MSLRVGLGASQADLDVQGEIDFDFFDESDCSNTKNKRQQWQLKSSEPSSDINTSELCSNSLSELSGQIVCDENGLKYCEDLKNSADSQNFNKPLIRVSRDDASGVIQKTTIETVIPTPFTYKDNKCGKLSPLGSKRGKSTSPRRKGKLQKEEAEASDDSSVSSMSGSESISSVSEDSFELDETDSMTDVSPIASPYCYTPTSEKTGLSGRFSCSSDVKENKREGVKFTDEIKEQECAKCSTIDFKELVSAMNRLQMKQDVSSLRSERHQSPVLTHKSRCRKNLSFSNEEVRKIDGDNQILLKKIIAQQNRSKTLPFSAVPIRSSSAVNRQKQQRQTELDNLALLKRLEASKPSHNLSRSHLLRDYDRRSSGLLSRSLSRSSYPGSSSQTSYSASSHTSGRSSSISVKSVSNLTSRSVLSSQTHMRSSSSK